MYTGPAQDIASLLTSAVMTQISYNAGGSSVDDRRAYPYLLRTGPNGKVASKVSPGATIYILYIFILT